MLFSTCTDIHQQDIQKEEAYLKFLVPPYYQRKPPADPPSHQIPA